MNTKTELSGLNVEKTNKQNIKRNKNVIYTRWRILNLWKKIDVISFKMIGIGTRMPE